MYYVEKPGWHGMVFCECRKIREAERILRQSGLEGEIAEKRFDNFEIKYPWQQELKDKAIAYGKAYFEAKANGWKYPWFYVGGQSGTGKSHICTAICGVMLKRGIPIRYMKWTTESRRLRALANTPDYDGLLDKLIGVEILYIDDLFKQRSHKQINVSDAEGRVLFEILNERYIQNKSTIISSEWFLRSELIEQVDDGTLGRAFERTRAGEFVVNIERKPENNFRLYGNEEGE